MLALSIATACDGGGGGIQFHGEQEFLPGFSYDSGLIPDGSPVQVRVTAHASGGTSVDARATRDGSSLTPVAGSGAIQTGGDVALEVYAKIDVTGVQFDGLVDSRSITLAPAQASFDPFLLDGGSAAVMATLSPSDLGSLPIPGVPGATLALAVRGGTVTTTFAGTCARAVDGRGQYRGHVTTGGTIDLSATVVVEVPFVGSQSFGPFDVAVPVATESDLDLGTYLLANGSPSPEGMPPCDAVAMDDGGMPGADGSITRDDGGMPAADGSVASGDGGGACGPLSYLAPTGSVCAMSTYDCLVAASDRDAGQACVDADPMPTECADCLQQDILATCTMAPATCADELGLLSCCVERTCPDGNGACVAGSQGPGGACAGESNALGRCIETDSSTGSCGVTSICFMGL